MTHLDVGVQVHEGPLAVAGVDAQGQLHLLVQHHKDAHSLLLRSARENNIPSPPSSQWRASVSLRILFSLAQELVTLSLHAEICLLQTSCLSTPSTIQVQVLHTRPNHLSLNHLITFSPSWPLDLSHVLLRLLFLHSASTSLFCPGPSTYSLHPGRFI